MTEKTDQSAQISLRLHRGYVDRAEALVEWFQSESKLTPTGQASRAEVLRAAIDRGLVELERMRGDDGQ